MLDTVRDRDRHAAEKLERRLQREATPTNNAVLDGLTLGELRQRMSRTIGTSDRRALLALIIERLHA